MRLDLDESSPVPLYLQIVEQVRRGIAAGALKPGDRIPTIRDLAVRARVNRNTAARAISTLEGEGLVRTRVGQGTFVVDGAPFLDARRRAEALDADLDRLAADARALGIPPKDLVDRLARRLKEVKS